MRAWPLRALLDSTRVDIRLAARSLVAAPQFSIVAFATILLTVGGLSAVFTVVNAVVLTPLPFPQSDRIISIRQQVRNGPLPLNSVALSDLVDVRASSRALERVAGYFSTTFTLDPDQRPYTIRLWRTTADLFPMLGARPILGRVLEPGDERPDATPVAVISYDVWVNRFGRRDEVLGEVIRLPIQGRSSFDLVVVGVLPQGFELPLDAVPPFPGVWTAIESGGALPRGGGGLTTVAQLRTGVSIVSARAELDAIGSRLGDAYPETNRERRFIVMSLLDLILGNTARVLLLFFGAMTCVLLIGVANLINLQVARNAVRQREFAICAALGAGRGRLLRQQVTETLLLSLAGGIAGTVAGGGVLQTIVSLLPAGFPRTDEIALTPGVLVFTLAVSVVVGTLVGVVPAWRMSSSNLTPVINESTPVATMSRRRSRLQRLLIAAETALAVILLVGAALLVNSLWRLMAIDAGVADESRSWSVGVTLPPSYLPVDRLVPWWQGALEQVRTLPQVDRAALSLGPPPLSGLDSMLSGVIAEGWTGDPKQTGVTLSHRPVSDAYFETLGIPLRDGRPIADTDDQSREPVVVINDAAARVLWPAENAIGKRLRDPLFAGRLATVVGVVPDFRQRLRVEPLPQLYRPYRQDRRPHGLTGFLLVREASESRGLIEAITSTLTSLEPRSSVRFQTMAELRWRQVADERFRTGILSSFAVTASLLALAGIFGVVAHGVAQRTREIGVRMALGARQGDILWLVSASAMLPCLAGATVGLMGAIGLSRFVASFLFELTPTDPSTYAAVVVCLLLASLAASVIPARRAMRLDPMIALRCE
jgi:putative ABC transport system permease protein